MNKILTSHIKTRVIASVYVREIGGTYEPRRVYYSDGTSERLHHRDDISQETIDSVRGFIYDRCADVTKYKKHINGYVIER